MLIKRIEKRFVSWLKQHWSNLFLGAGSLVFYILRYFLNAFPQRVFVFEFFTRLFWENSVFKGDYWIDGLYNGTSLASALVSPLTYCVFLPTKILDVELYSIFLFSAVTAGILFLVRKILSRLTQNRAITFVGTFAFFVFPLFHTVTNKYGRIDIVLAVLFVLLFVNLLLDFKTVKMSWLKVTLVCLGILFSNFAVFQAFLLLLLPFLFYGLFCAGKGNDLCKDLYKALPKMALIFCLGSIGFWLPLLVETGWLYFPSHDLAQNLISDFGVSSIFEFVNRNGQLASVLESSGVEITSSSIYFMGFTFMPALGVILWMWDRVVQKKLAIGAIVVCVLGIFLSMAMTWIDVSYVRQISMVLSEAWGLTTGLAGIVLCLLVVAQKCSTRLWRPTAIASFLVIAIIFICGLPPVFMLFPFVILLLVMPLGFSVLLVIALDVVRKIFIIPRDFLILTGIVLALVLWDFAPYLGFESVGEPEDGSITSLSEPLEIDPGTTVLQLDVMDSLGSKITHDNNLRFLSGYWELFPSSETGKYYFEHIYGTLLTNFRLNKDRELLEQGFYDFNVHYLLDNLRIKPNVEDTNFIPLETFSIIESNEDFVLVNTGSVSRYVSSEPKFVIEPLARVTDFSNEDMTNIAAQRSRQIGSITADYADLGIEFTECDDEDIIAVSTEMCELDIEDAIADVENLKIHNNKVEFNLKSSNGIIILKETYYPYWRAMIGDDQIKPMRTNIINLGFYVGDKTGQMNINYSVPLIYFVTFWLSCISVLLSSIMVVGFNEKK